MLTVSALLLVVGALSHRLELSCHLFDGASEVGQLRSDAAYVLIGRHGLRSLLSSSGATCSDSFRLHV